MVRRSPWRLPVKYGSDRSIDSSRSTAARSLLAYLAVFGFLTYAWWSTATYAVAPGNDPNDARLIVWILGWVAHALAHMPTKVFDAPIFFPAPAQLAGSEHLMSAQLVFAPTYWATGNAVLAANVVALLSFPAAAFAMERLLAAQRLSPAGAWLGGLAFALGWMRETASLQVLQYLTMFLPLVALRVARLRERPDAGQWVLLTLCLVAGMLSSYYLALLVAVTTAIWGAFELVRCESHRARFIALVGLSLLVASSILASISGPYFHQWAARAGPDTIGAATRQPPVSADGYWATLGLRMLVVQLHRPIWVTFAALALWGALAGLRAPASRRKLTATGVTFVLTGGALLVLGWPWFLAPWFGFFRIRGRYLLLSSMGASLLVALGFDALRARVSLRGGSALLLGVFGGALVWARIGVLAPESDAVLATSRDRDGYRGLRTLIREHGPGPLLELPYVSTVTVKSAPEQMVGQLDHGMPLITGFTGYSPPHARLLARLVSALPAEAALDDLVDLTHLRWILVRPADEWPNPAKRRALLAGLARTSARGPVWRIGPWILQRLDRVPGHQPWFDALAAGPRPDQSVLGTSLAPIREEDAIAAISARLSSGPTPAGGFAGIEVVAHNRGAAGWPAWVADGWDEPGIVHWEVRWRRIDGSHADWGPATMFPLRRDVPPGEVLSERLVLSTPAEVGSYELRVTVRQTDGATFSALENEVATLQLDLTPRWPRRSGPRSPPRRAPR